MAFLRCSEFTAHDDKYIDFISMNDVNFVNNNEYDSL